MKSGKNLNFTDTGEGEIALVFLHYFGGSSNTWQKVTAELSSQFRCIAIDLPGFGDSQSELDNLSVSFYAEEVLQLITDLVLKQYILIGHSMGGKIALALASMQPVGLQSVVLLAPSPPTPEPMDDSKRKSLKDAYGNYTALEAVVNSSTANQLPAQEVADAVNDDLRTAQIAWNWWLDKGSLEDISAQMPSVEVHVSVISGEKDPNFSRSFLRKEMLKFFPTSSYTEILDAGHLLPVEKSLAVARLVKEFSIR